MVYCSLCFVVLMGKTLLFFVTNLIHDEMDCEKKEDYIAIYFVSNSTVK